MKKWTAAVLALVIATSVAGCQHKNSQPADDQLRTSEIEQQPEIGQSETGQPNQWGITLEVQNVTSTGLTMICDQSGGENLGELDTGSYYELQRFENGKWEKLEYLPQEYLVCWGSIALLVNREGTTEWEYNWDTLYGELPAGEYRIGKRFMNFRAPGDYDAEMLYAEFTI